MPSKAPKSRKSKTVETVAARKVLLLRTCKSDMTSHNGFLWPESGYVEAPDWDGGKPVCGGKLHGFLFGEGDGSLANWSPDAKWLVVEADETAIVAIDKDKHGFRAGTVVFCGDQIGATTYLLANGAAGRAVIGATVSAGHRGTATTGDWGTATAGNRGTATVGDYGTATAGDNGTATAGNSGTATVGDYGTATAGNKGTATVGDYGTATAGDNGTAMARNSGTATAGHYGTATAGHYGTATTGDWGTATAGNRGTATVGDYGTATAGEDGVITIRWWDDKRFRVTVGYIGEEGLEPNVTYRLKDSKFVPANSTLARAGDGDF